MSIDDFGTRYSSLARISQFAVSELKIDRAFVSGMRHNEADLAVVKMVIELGKALGLRVVAEGIEVDADADELCPDGLSDRPGFPVRAADAGSGDPEWSRPPGSGRSAARHFAADQRAAPAAPPNSGRRHVRGEGARRSREPLAIEHFELAAGTLSKGLELDRVQAVVIGGLLLERLPQAELAVDAERRASRAT